ncbi:Methyltransferase type 11 [Chlorella sorokiniana]|uniref:Methyltransferase type 11 n=1 Tax=Chlorella sorokiniana TaxID=3076 RepID=A0A2P6TIU4_CHLSO|nr:Methyltransferase type 11 [Chlorella sorokiniana]|eukprot:PRW39171.1 Methyltransferase type 11 [Chlorella sorokiniana]
MASLTPAERLQLLARSWTTVAEGYRSNFVHRFAPWTQDTLQAFVQAGGSLPESGAIAVPACGPGQELPLLAAAFPRHRIVGIDLSEGMAALARQLVQQQGLEGRVEVRVGDASRLDDLAPLAGVVSVFGLQQMPQPAAVLANWTRALAPGGVLCVCYWPQIVEERGPWQLLTALTASFRPQTDWEQCIPGHALGEGAQLLQDERISHEMEWRSVSAFWDGMTRAGPWHSRRLAFGDEHMEELRQKFMEQPEYSDPAAPVLHTATARLVCLRRLQAQAAL